MPNKCRSFGGDDFHAVVPLEAKYATGNRSSSNEINSVAADQLISAREDGGSNDDMELASSANTHVDTATPNRTITKLKTATPTRDAGTPPPKKLRSGYASPTTTVALAAKKSMTPM